MLIKILNILIIHGIIKEWKIIFYIIKIKRILNCYNIECRIIYKLKKANINKLKKTLVILIFISECLSLKKLKLNFTKQIGKWKFEQGKYKYKPSLIVSH
jgi:hypothetical protein